MFVSLQHDENAILIQFLENLKFSGKIVRAMKETVKILISAVLLEACALLSVILIECTFVYLPVSWFCLFCSFGVISCFVIFQISFQH